MVRFTAKLTLVLGLCAAIALAGPTVNQATDDRQHVICDKGYCYPRVFRPTHEFQEVLEGQEIPSGLHVQMDFETHRKYAKLMDPKDGTSAQDEESNKNSILVVDTDTPGIYQHDVSGDKHTAAAAAAAEAAAAEQVEASRLNLQNAFDSISDFDTEVPTPAAASQTTDTDKKPHHAIIPPSGNRQYFNEQLEIVRSSNNNDDVLEALENLADIASDMEFGILLTENTGLRVLEKRLYCQNESSCADDRLIRAKTAVVISASLQNFNAAQEQAYKGNLHKVLLARLESEKNEHVLVRLLSAYTNLVRGGNGKIRSRDVQPLARIFDRHTDPFIRQKFVYLVTDYVDPEMQYVAASTDDKETESETKSLPTFSKLNIGPWCQALQAPGVAEEVEEIDRALELLNAYNPDACPLYVNSSREDL
ncbi:hypothetical protein BG004_004057 [Podila humilis]|nr:hypothetical protein BG004_004057 [Podila humilis]